MLLALTYCEACRHVGLQTYKALPGGEGMQTIPITIKSLNILMLESGINPTGFGIA